MSFLQHILILFIVILINGVNTSTTSIESTTQSIYEKAIAEILKTQNDWKSDEEQLILDRSKFEEEKQIPEIINKTDIFRLNVGGDIIMTTRETLTRVPKSILSMIFNGRWEYKLQRDQEGNIFLDFNPIVFRHLLDQLQLYDTNNLNHISPPSQSSFLVPFKKMIGKLGLNHLLSSEKNIITFNIGGQMMTNRHTTFNQISNSTIDTIMPSNRTTNLDDTSDVFLDYDPKLFRHLINQLREESFKTKCDLKEPSIEERITFNSLLDDLNIFRQSLPSTQINTNTKWKQNGITIAGGNGEGKQLNQLHGPAGIDVDDDHQCIYITEYHNNRIVQWKFGAKIGQVVAGGNGYEYQMNRLSYPTDVTVDKKNDSLIICDANSKRVVRWPRHNPINKQTIISDIDCSGLTMDNNGDLYVSDSEKHEVRRWKIGETNGTIVAGGKGQGHHLNQLDSPSYIFVDEDHSVYVSDQNNHRVMKWLKGAQEGIVAAGGQGQGNSLIQLSNPQGVYIDHTGNVYVADYGNNRIMRWSPGCKEGSIVVGGNGKGPQPNQFEYPADLSFDRHGNLYVADYGNNRIQKFDIA